MANRRMEFFIGMMVIGIVAGVFIMTILFGSERGFFVGGGGKRMTILFERGGGISQNSMVLKNGIKIGRVYAVDLLDDKDKAEVRVGFELYPEAKIFSNEYAKINRTFLGDASIEFVKNPDFKGDVVEITPKEVIRGVPGGDIMGTVSNIEGDLAKAIQNVNQAAQGLTLFMNNLNDFLGDEEELNAKKMRLQAVFTELNETLISIKSLATHMDSIVSDQELNENVRSAAQKVPQILQRVDDLMASANSLTGDLRQTMDRAGTTLDLVDKNLDNVNVFTTSLSEQGPEMMTSLNESAAEVKTMVQNIASLAQELADQVENPKTPLGMLADEETAASLRRIVRNSEEITEKVYPILDDARVFSNKIAHRPSSLIWDKTSSKGTPTTGRYGMQSESPRGGVSSPLYRRTPSGGRVCERSYRYSPAADVDTMDARTRAEYESAYPRTVADRGKWSFGAFWNKIFAKKDGDSVPTYSYPASYAPVYSTYSASAGGARPVGFDARFDAGKVDGAIYAGFNGEVATPNFNGASSGANSIPLGPYAASENAASPIAVESSSVSNESVAPIEELPTSINRIVGAPSNGLSNAVSSNSTAESARRASNAASANVGAFEDDGLPMRFAPPTRR